MIIMSVMFCIYLYLFVFTQRHGMLETLSVVNRGSRWLLSTQQYPELMYYDRFVHGIGVLSTELMYCSCFVGFMIINVSGKYDGIAHFVTLMSGYWKADVRKLIYLLLFVVVVIRR